MLGYIVQHFSFLALDVALLRWLVMLSIRLTNVLVNYTLFKKNFFQVLHCLWRGGEGSGRAGCEQKKLKMQLCYVYYLCRWVKENSDCITESVEYQVN